MPASQHQADFATPPSLFIVPVWADLLKLEKRVSGWPTGKKDFFPASMWPLPQNWRRGTGDPYGTVLGIVVIGKRLKVATWTAVVTGPVVGMRLSVGT